MAQKIMHVTPDLSCPYCKGQGKHPKSQRPDCKRKGGAKSDALGNKGKK